MTEYQRRVVALAICLSCLAGYVDAIGFITLGGFFVSFMTGNSTRLGIELATGHAEGIATAAGVILLFVVGVVLGALVGHLAPASPRAAVLAWVTLCLAAAALAYTMGSQTLAIAGLVLAMGAENAIFQRNGETTIGLTYMTGTLVKVGQRIAGSLVGAKTGPWNRHLTLWLGLVLGAVAGALAHQAVGLHAIWGAALLAALLTIVTVFLPVAE
jgi:uncharacterized membrane protein YoaK (UPF0700 family)